MSILKSRIVQGATGVGPNLRMVAQFATPEQLPENHLLINPGYLTYGTLDHLITADGAPVVATGNFGMGSLYPAGRTK